MENIFPETVPKNNNLFLFFEKITDFFQICLIIFQVNMQLSQQIQNHLPRHIIFTDAKNIHVHEVNDAVN